MGFLKNTSSFSRFNVNPSSVLPEDYRRIFAANILRFSFREIDDQSDDAQSVGWVDIADPMNTDFKGEEFFKGDFITLGLRTDSRKVPSQALKDQFRKALKEKWSNGEPSLAKDQRIELKEAIKLQLLKRAIPSTKLCDFMWNTQTSEVYFSATSERDCLQFLGIFKETFGINLTQLFPYSIAQEIVSIDQHSHLDHLSPAVFTETPNKVQEMTGGSNMISLIQDKKFLGQEFLIWLWYRSQVDAGKISTTNPILELWIDNNIVLESAGNEGGKAEKVICCHGEMFEARGALSQGKKITKASFKMFLEENEYSFTLDGTWLNFKACKTPKIPIDKDDIDGTFFERVYLLQAVVKAITRLFEDFIKIRMTTKWPILIQEIKDWMAKE